ncbi:cob(I)yrinic acid a,c-diamide adenosyltransferase [Halorutilales archaeon Cl-col2-1]
MKIYTGRGDKGQTDLRNGGRVSKSSARIEAYGTVDELNAHVGFAASNLDAGQHGDVVDVLKEVQNRLFKAQAHLSNPDKGEDDPRVTDDDTDWLEEKCDDFDEEIPPLESFILPSGSSAGSSLHLARTVCRRSERRSVGLLAEVEETEGTDVDDTQKVVQFLNRLSDLLFILGRVVNHREGTKEERPTY